MRTFPHDDETQPPQARAPAFVSRAGPSVRTRAPAADLPASRRAARPPGRTSDAPATREHPQYGTRIRPRSWSSAPAGRGARARAESPPARQAARPWRGGRFVPRDSGPRGPRPAGPPLSGRRSASRRPASRGASGARGAPDLRPPGRASPAHPQRERYPRSRGPAPTGVPLKPYRTGVQSAGEGRRAASLFPKAAPHEGAVGPERLPAVRGAPRRARARRLRRDPEAAAGRGRPGAASACRPRGLEVLLEALVALGLLHRHGATYVLPRVSVPSSFRWDGHAAGMIEMAAELYGAWGDLARAVRDGAPRVRLNSDALLEGDPARARRYVRAVHAVSREAAPRIADLAPLLPGSTLLDVAGGSGSSAPSTRGGRRISRPPLRSAADHRRGARDPP